MNTDSLTFYKSRSYKIGPAKWRWRYVAAGNHQKMANGGESYEDLAQTIESAFRVCNIEQTSQKDDYEGVGEIKRRTRGTQVRVQVEY